MAGLDADAQAFSRLILFEKRGTGLSDAISGIAGLERGA
jgi:hypothetical protein